MPEALVEPIREGRGPVVFMVPPTGGLSARFAIDAIGPLRKYATVLTFDARGDTDRPLAAAATAAATLLAAADLRDVTLLAHGAGVTAAAAVAAREPDRIARVIAVAPVTDSQARGVAPSDPVARDAAAAHWAATDAVLAARDATAAWRWLATLPQATALEDGGAALVLEELAKREDAAAVAALLPRVAAELATAPPPHFTVPTWLVTGRNDALAPRAAAAAIAAASGAHWSEYADASHVPFFEKAAVFHRHCRDFVTRGVAPKSATQAARA